MGAWKFSSQNRDFLWVICRDKTRKQEDQKLQQEWKQRKQVLLSFKNTFCNKNHQTQKKKHKATWRCEMSYNKSLDFVWVHKNAKRELGQYPPILTLCLVDKIIHYIIIHIYWPVRLFQTCCLLLLSWFLPEPLWMLSEQLHHLQFTEKWNKMIVNGYARFPVDHFSWPATQKLISSWKLNKAGFSPQKLWKRKQTKKAFLFNLQSREPNKIKIHLSLSVSWVTSQQLWTGCLCLIHNMWVDKVR